MIDPALTIVGVERHGERWGETRTGREPGVQRAPLMEWHEHVVAVQLMLGGWQPVADIVAAIDAGAVYRVIPQKGEYGSKEYERTGEPLYVGVQRCGHHCGSRTLFWTPDEARARQR